MYMIIRVFERVRSPADATKRAETGIGQLMKKSAGFQGYYIFDAGGGTLGSVTLFDSQSQAEAANEKAMAWARAGLADLVDGEPVVTIANVVSVVTANGM